jgi:(S)-mandelate dehydrogenase
MKVLARAGSIGDLRTLAARRLPRMVFDYIDGAAGEETTARLNRDDFDHVLLQPDVLADVATRSLETTFFGRRAALPIIIGPTGLNGAFWPDGDLALARAAAAENIPFTMSTAATTTLDPLVAVAGPMRWFQLYMLRDRGLVKAFLERIAGSGFDVLELTVDTAVAGRRNRDIRNGFTLPFKWTPTSFIDTAVHTSWALSMLREGSPTLRLFGEVLGQVPKGATISEVMQQQISASFTWDDVAWLRAQWPGTLVLKGLSTPLHAMNARMAAVDGAVVSNHGGRQLDGAPSTIGALPAFIEAAGDMTILIDSGFRSGVDIAKALALGAHGVQLGRATLFGLATAGEAGVRHAVDILRRELDIAMALCGATSIDALRGRAVLTRPAAFRPRS